MTKIKTTVHDHFCLQLVSRNDLVLFQSKALFTQMSMNFLIWTSQIYLHTYI